MPVAGESAAAVPGAAVMTAEAASREWPGVTTAAGAGERRRVARTGNDAGTAMARGHAGIDQTEGLRRGALGTWKKPVFRYRNDGNHISGFAEN